MYLELAEGNNQGPYSMMAQAPGEDTSDLYVYLPAQFTNDGQGMYAREDSFDLLPEHEWEKLQDVLEPFQQRNLSLFGLGKKGRARRKARRAERQARKVERMGVRTERVSVRGAAGGGALGKVGDILGNILGGGGAAGAPMPDEYAPETSYQPPPPAKKILGMPPIAAAGIGGVALLILVLAVMGKRGGKK